MHRFQFVRCISQTNNFRCYLSGNNEALLDTKEHAIEGYPSDPAGWGMAIDLLRELAMEEDVRRLSEYCSDPKYNRYLGDED